MAWSLSSWLMFTRTFQLLGALASAALNGFLTAWIYTHKSGLTQSMVVLELMICLLLGYTTLAMIIQRTGNRSRSKGWLACFVGLDVLFCAADLAIVCMLARAGLPDHCHGMTKADSLGDMYEDGTYFTTPGFSDGSEGEVGRLDKFCGYERFFFIIAVALVFTYIVTIVLGALGIYETTHTQNTKVGELLDSLERANKSDDIDLKLLDSGTSPLEREPRQSMPAPPSEGIITRTASLRSTLTSLTSSTTAAQRPYAIPRRPIPQSAPPLPPRRLSLTKPGSPPPQGMGSGFVPAPLDEDSAEAALVADGMQHNQHPSPSHHQNNQQRPLMFDDVDAAHVADGLQHQPHRSHRRGASATQGMPMPMLLEEEQTAESALVSDGMRPFEPMLPPYEPGSSRMAGHGSESNDMRLSEYVKGETRAQDMKDSGGY